MNKNRSSIDQVIQKLDLIYKMVKEMRIAEEKMNRKLEKTYKIKG